ncbi:D-glycero-alpha-D-manno-heptose-1,7-bisphosphate 7-phosphatase [Anatilimnocola aggregata]|uniref:D-glycero-alpha-D-manno-heptose-1,7-bisphosphate 7-phosphatase n=1 Tax=Anatilimnocola aggregata TaxID=2528021 RepID=A0A517YA65_9BACT|nr:HAD-IIIA family hydrolase [Anatilimnocola aggregata]QDU27133.1 D-glycero-alpha-D-manno-heptose-1,7-bisphosphate 7-phosphatase [Anatilimnocola aggregata]
MLKAFLLAAGLGTRLAPLTNNIPKCLLPFAGRPLLDYWFELLADAGCLEARVNTHAHAGAMREYLESEFPAKYPQISESHEPTLLGSAGAIAANPDFANGASEVVIICADQISDVDIAAMLDFHRQHGDPLTMLLYRVNNPTECGIVDVDADARVIEFTEKPQFPKGNLANGGIYIVSAAAYREIAQLRQFDFGFDILPRFVGRMRGWTWAGVHRDIGTHTALAKAKLELPSVVKTIASRTEAQPAIFLDRDGTLIESVHYLTHPSQVRVMPDAAATLRRFHLAGYRCVVTTNQSVIGRGLLTEDGLRLVHDEMTRQLAEQRAWLDAIYHCPFAPSSDPAGIQEHSHRKPNPGMLLQAAGELNLDLSRSWMIGDTDLDVEAGCRAGCCGSLKLVATTDVNIAEERYAHRYDNTHCVPSLTAAADLIFQKVSQPELPCVAVGSF